MQVVWRRQVTGWREGRATRVGAQWVEWVLSAVLL